MTYQFAKGYPKDDYLWPSVTKVGKDFNDESKLRGFTQWGANQTIEWIKQNCVKSRGNFPHFKVNDAQLNSARFNFRDVSDEASRVGSAVHKAAEEYLKTGKKLETDNAQIKSGFAAFLEWLDENKVEPIAVEETVYGDFWAGTLDLRCWLTMKGWSERKQYVIDFKTSKKINKKEMGTQIAAYRSTFDVRSDCIVEGCGILRLDKETGLNEWWDASKDYERYLLRFNRLFVVYMSDHKIISNKAGWKEDA